ncbi:MAG: thioesterase family protein [Pseudomonadota bacterium]
MHNPHETYVTVKPEWIDHNGHMNVAYYVLAFDLATDSVYEHWGLGMDYPQRENCSTFTLGMNVDYHQETFEGQSLRIVTQLADYDEKRVHYIHAMYHGETDELCATNECLAMNIDLNTRRGAPFPADVTRTLKDVHALHGSLVMLSNFGRKLGIRRKGD